MNSILLRSLLASFTFTLLLGIAFGVSCLPENVICSAAGSQAGTLVNEALIAFGLALFVTLSFEMVVKALSLGATVYDGAYAIALAVPILVPYCIGTGCRSGGTYWMVIAVAVASVGAAVSRRLIIRSREQRA